MTIQQTSLEVSDCQGLVGLLQRKRAEQSGHAGHAKEARMFCQVFNILVFCCVGHFQRHIQDSLLTFLGRLLITLAHLSCTLCFWDQEHHIEEKSAPNEDAAAATDAVTSAVTESKVRTEEQPQKPQQQPLLLAASEEEAHLSLGVSRF